MPNIICTRLRNPVVAGQRFGLRAERRRSAIVEVAVDARRQRQDTEPTLRQFGEPHEIEVGVIELRREGRGCSGPSSDVTSNPGVISSGKSRDGSGTATVRNVLVSTRPRLSGAAAVEPAAGEREFLKETVLVRGETTRLHRQLVARRSAVPIRANSPSSGRDWRIRPPPSPEAEAASHHMTRASRLGQVHADRIVRRVSLLGSRADRPTEAARRAVFPAPRGRA